MRSDDTINPWFHNDIHTPKDVYFRGLTLPDWV